MTVLAVIGGGSMGAQIAQPSPQLGAKVKAGKLGRKTKEGWYRYD
jgi:3-hydroxyacyl-CoA dehydrogenase